MTIKALRLTKEKGMSKFRKGESIEMQRYNTIFYGKITKTHRKIRGNQQCYEIRILVSEEEIKEEGHYSFGGWR